MQKDAYMLIYNQEQKVKWEGYFKYIDRNWRTKINLFLIFFFFQKENLFLINLALLHIIYMQPTVYMISLYNNSVCNHK